jgi:CYTH domain-containing protein
MPEVLPATGAVAGIEIERKFLLRSAPSAAVLAAHGAVPRRLEQVYLVDPPAGRRIRRIDHADGRIEYRLTIKRRLRAFAYHEEEERIDAARYESLLLQADPAGRPIRKVRHVVPHGRQVLEIDVFETPPGLVLLEVELEQDDEPVELPAWVGEWREVTGDPAYMNASIARSGTGPCCW